MDAIVEYCGLSTNYLLKLQNWSQDGLMVATWPHCSDAWFSHHVYVCMGLLNFNLCTKLYEGLILHHQHHLQLYVPVMRTGLIYWTVPFCSLSLYYPNMHVNTYDLLALLNSFQLNLYLHYWLLFANMDLYVWLCNLVNVSLLSQLAT